MSFLRLDCPPMKYKWGKIGKDSLVYQLLSESGSSAELSLEEPFAELWMGDHPSAPSITEHGERISMNYGHIPFLAKVLSVRTPLSIQVHPNKEQAESLRAENPQFYPDDNEKPEMSVFLAPTLLLYGFRPLSEIVSYLKEVPEFAEICGNDAARSFCDEPNSSNLQNIVYNLLHSSPEKIQTQIASFLSHVNGLAQSSSPKYSFDPSVTRAIELISTHFPGDVGIFFPFLLNVVRGNFGDALFIPSGILHAYLEGDLYEIMSVSDNVIRAAMTPKHIDIPNLFKVVKFEETVPSFVRPVRSPDTNSISVYRSPFEKFLVTFIQPSGEEKIKIPAHQNVSIMLTLSGSCNIDGKHLKKGSVHLVPKMSSLEMSELEPESIIIIASNP